MASERALSCILMLVELAWALILVGQFGEAREELNRAIFVESHADSMVHNVEVIRDVLDKEELIAYNKKQVESQLLYIKVAEQGRDVGNLLKKLADTRVQAYSILKSASELAHEQPNSVRAKLMHPHLVLSLLVSGRLNDRRRVVSHLATPFESCGIYQCQHQDLWWFLLSMQSY
jgi:hypothetical protein